MLFTPPFEYNARMPKERANKEGSNIPDPTNAELAELENTYLKNYRFDYSAIQKVDIKDLLGLHLADIPEIQMNTLEEDIALAKRIEKGGEDANEAREALLYSVSHMIVSEAVKYTLDRQTMMDLIQEGHMAVWEKAIKRYDWKRGFKFSTYAMWWIRSVQFRYLSKNSRPFNVSEKMIFDSNKVAEVFSRSSTKNQYNDALKDVAETIGIKPSKVKELLDLANQKLISLSSLTNTPEKTEFGETIEDKAALHGASLEDRIDEKQVLDSFRVKLTGELSHLIPRQRQVIMFRLGIGNNNEWDGKPMALEQIGKIMGGVSRERVRQIQKEALRHIKDKEIREILIKFLSPRRA